MAEKRQHRRIKRRLIVKFGEKELSQSGFTVDVSPTGELRMGAAFISTSSS